MFYTHMYTLTSERMSNDTILQKNHPKQPSHPLYCFVSLKTPMSVVFVMKRFDNFKQGTVESKYASNDTSYSIRIRTFEY